MFDFEIQNRVAVSDVLLDSCLKKKKEEEERNSIGKLYSVS